MKKILLTLTLVAVTAMANAQFVVSAQLGGMFANGNTNEQILTIDTLGLPQSNITDTPFAKELVTTGGVKFGYQFGKLQVGLCASFSWFHSKDTLTPATYCDRNTNPDNIHMTNPNLPYENFDGWFTEQHTNFTIAPYLHYEIIQLGDVAFFAELTGYFSKSNNPKRQDYMDWYYREMHNTVDTTYTIQHYATAIGAKITPGLSWQLSPHCYVDLYLDVLAFTFEKTYEQEITIVDDYDLIAVPHVLSRRTVVTTETNGSNMGFNVAGSPMLSSRNWVRMGINYTF